MLLEPLTLWLARTNAWIIAPQGPGGDCVLVDAPPEPGPLLARLNELHLRPTALLATHGHVDHVGGIATVAAAVDEPFPVHIHDDDRHMFDKILPLEDDLVVLPGHGRTTTIGRERATNPFLVGLDSRLATSIGGTG